MSREVLRAWERRYGLLQPERTDGGFRLYSEADLARVARMQAHLADGLSAAQAARLALAEAEAPQPAGDTAAPDALADELADALAQYDEPRAQALFDRMLAAFSLDSVLRDIVLPVMRDLGERWASGEATVAQEHFASNVVRGRLSALARGWDRGAGPRALLALPPHERHEFGLLAFALALRSHGWRITYLGADTPVETLYDAARLLQPDLIVLSASVAGRFEPVEQELREVADIAPVAIGGAGATAALVGRVGARLLDMDAVTAAAAVAS